MLYIAHFKCFIATKRRKRIVGTNHNHPPFFTSLPTKVPTAFFQEKCRRIPPAGTSESGLLFLTLSPATPVEAEPCEDHRYPSPRASTDRPSGSIKGDVKKKHSSSSARRGYFSDIQPPSADARILAEARLGRTDFAGGCGIINCCVPSRGLIAPSSSVLAIANHGSI